MLDFERFRVIRLHAGDCREILKTLDADSVDACVTDPPYELAFMGKAWDSTGVAFDPATWREVFRVLKPGAHLLAFGGTRTSHRMVCAIEDAGFEIRDGLAWIFGSGFPKNLDVSKALDKMAGAERKVVGTRTKTGMGGSQTFAQDEWTRNNVGNVEIALTEPESDLAKIWAGWGTALKPAHEPICLARKPFRGTVAENVARHGVGAINVDGCRIATGEPVEAKPKKPLVARNEGAGSTNFAMTSGNTHPAGRWPANILHDGSDEVLAVFPESDGATTVSRSGKVGLFDDGIGPSDLVPGYADTGSAARFFYCAKVSPAERDDGLAHLDPVAFARSTGAQSAVAAGLDNQGAGAVGMNKVQQVRNTHPTVKPTDLMAYLCRLITPPGGTVLDPFCGSGSTGRGAVREQFHFIGIDLDPHNIAISEARIHAAAPLFARAAE